jgi:low temperature requirement protein LtrA
MSVRVGRPRGSGPAARRGSRWLAPPQLRTLAQEDDHRHATWLELFFDLVFVVAITVLAHELVGDPSTGGFLRFAGLFVPVYVAWQGFSIYADRFDSDDLLFRVTFFAAMLAIAAMAVLLGDVWHGENTVELALAYVALRSLMLLLYARAWIAVPDARPLIRVYGPGYAVAAGIWLVSIAVDTPARYVLWGVALALDLSLPPLTTRLHRRVPTHGAHIPERWALFTMVVIGESVVAVALETAGAEWRAASVAAAVLGFTAICAVWWLYFDRQANVVLQGTSPAPVIYSYGHLPLLMGLAATGAGVILLIEHAGDDHLGRGGAVALLGGVALFVVSLVVTRLVAIRYPRWRLGLSLKLGVAAILVGLIFAEAVLPPVALAGALAAVLVGYVFLERTLFPPETA